MSPRYRLLQISSVLLLAMCSAKGLLAGITLLDGNDLPYRNQWAIVVGINYAGREEAAAEGVTELKNAEADALAVAATLKAFYGYSDDSLKLLIGQEATKDAIVRLFGDRFLSDPDLVNQDDSVLVFFAGHGDRQTRNDRSRAVIWPYDVATIPGKGVDSSSCVRINNLLQDLELCSARHKLIILDSCHSGEVFRSGGLARSAGRFKFDQEIFGQTVLQAMAASRGFQKAQDGTDHSPFTMALLESLYGGIQSNSFGASALFSRIPERVKEMSNQRPRGGTISGDGEFYFFRHAEPDTALLAQLEFPQTMLSGQRTSTSLPLAATGDKRGLFDGPFKWVLAVFMLFIMAGMAVLFSSILSSQRPVAAAMGAASQTLTDIPKDHYSQTFQVPVAPVATLAAGSNTKCILRIKDSDKESDQETTCVFGSQTNLGRSADCGFQLPLQQVSGEHARLRYVFEDDQFFIEDLGSRNGTYIVSNKIQESALLESGAKIQLAGSCLLEFNILENRKGDSVGQLIRLDSAKKRVGQFLLVPSMRLDLGNILDGAESSIFLNEEEGFYWQESAADNPQLLSNKEKMTCGGKEIEFHTLS